MDITLSFMTVWIVDKFWGIFFEKKASRMSVPVLAIYFVFQVYFQSDRGNLSLWGVFINIAFILFIAECRYHCRGKEKYFLTFLLYSVWSVFEVFLFFLIGMTEMKEPDVVGSIISIIIMFMSVNIISAVWNKTGGHIMSGRFYLPLLLIPVGSIYIFIHELFHGGGGGFPRMIAMSILLLFNIGVFEIYVKMNEMFMKEKESAVHMKQVDLISENMAEQEKMMEEFGEERHNLVNELITLQGSIENDDRENALKNLNRIIKKCHCTENVSNSGNSTVDAVINFKYALAKAEGIAFQMKIFIPKKLPIEQADIGVVLGNALDNAIEALRQCRNKEKVIEISMGIKKEAWVVVIKNPYENVIKRDKSGRILSAKEKAGHGYGLKSIEKIAQEYQGEMLISAEDGIFSLTVVLNFGK